MSGSFEGITLDLPKCHGLDMVDIVVLVREVESYWFGPIVSDVCKVFRDAGVE